MAQLRATLGLVLLSVVACDSAGDPIPSSTFAQQDNKAHDVSGILRRGEDGVTGAVVFVAPAPVAVPNTFTASVSTDAIGFYRVPGAVGWLYDLSFVMPRGADERTGLGGAQEKDVFVFRDVGYRYFEPQLDVSGRMLPRSWMGHVRVQLDQPLTTGHTLLFLASGDGVFGVTGDLETGLDVHTAKYEQSANIRAVEYDPARGLISASAYGKADVVSAVGRPTAVTLHLDPITLFASPSFTIDLPPGFVPGAVDIRVGSSRTSDALMVSILWGQTMSLPIVPDQDYSYQLRATRADGAISDSGEQKFDPHKPAPISLPAPPDAITPESGKTVEKGQTVSASGSGLLEHFFESTAPGAPSLRMVATQLDTTLPDFTALGVDKGTGDYVWTVRRFPTMNAPENIWGADARRYKPFAVSAPRALILR